MPHLFLATASHRAPEALEGAVLSDFLTFKMQRSSPPFSFRSPPGTHTRCIIGNDSIRFLFRLLLSLHILPPWFITFPFGRFITHPPFNGFVAFFTKQTTPSS